LRRNTRTNIYVMQTNLLEGGFVFWYRLCFHPVHESSNTVLIHMTEFCGLNGNGTVLPLLKIIKVTNAEIPEGSEAYDQHFLISFHHLCRTRAISNETSIHVLVTFTLLGWRYVWHLPLARRLPWLGLVKRADHNEDGMAVL
jgi:hypothetical protein